MIEVSQSSQKAESPLPYCSVLFHAGGPDASSHSYEGSDVFHDLNFNQIVENITHEYEEYELKEFFHRPLKNAASIRFRQEVMRDIDDGATAAQIRTFAARMRMIRETLSLRESLHHGLQKQIRLLEAVCHYCNALKRLSADLDRSDLHSQGLKGFRRYLADYIGSTSFSALAAQAENVKMGLDRVQYSLEIYGRRVKVSPYEEHPDFGGDVRKTFKKFQEGAGKRYNFEFRSYVEMNHVEAAILDRVAKLNSKEFAALNDFSDRHVDFMDDTIRRFDREVQFYIACIEYLIRMKAAGLAFCYPDISTESKEIYSSEAFDLALADQLIRERRNIVTNSFELKGRERILVISGPNQGGKTTFARMFGQIHYLASLGCQVPGRKVRLFLFDRLFTHFEREENVQNFAGKLEDDLLRIYHILLAASSSSILVMNESLLSTTVDDALFLSRRILELVIQKDMICLTVTFLDELASLGPETVSMVSEIERDDPAQHTFKVVRKPADGRAYALVVAEKYGLSYSSIKRRMRA